MEGYKNFGISPKLRFKMVQENDVSRHLMNPFPTPIDCSTFCANCNYKWTEYYKSLGYYKDSDYKIQPTADYKLHYLTEGMFEIFRHSERYRIEKRLDKKRKRNSTDFVRLSIPETESSVLKNENSTELCFGDSKDSIIQEDFEQHHVNINTQYTGKDNNIQNSNAEPTHIKSTKNHIHTELSNRLDEMFNQGVDSRKPIMWPVIPMSF